ncbi:response regulator [Salarchaeum japonicum]|uniref:Response regulatory domain-containing protein n=1 Tax=Salarchaeum japonicum TaxID=555573 RepID=A0AAV3T357_9EURY|nr:response regulator [Salarchaeum japonicum]
MIRTTSWGRSDGPTAGSNGSALRANPGVGGRTTGENPSSKDATDDRTRTDAGDGDARGDGAVLVVDDEQGFADAVALWLDDYEVVVAYDGDDALDAYTPDIDVVLLDRRMPTVPGDDVLRELRDRNADVRVAMLTASEIGVESADLPFDEYLQKPIDRDEVRDAVEALKRQHAYPEPVREYVSVLVRLSELESTHSRQRLVETDAYADLEARLDDVRPAAERAVEHLSDDEVEFLRAYVGDLERDSRIL